MGDSCEKRPFSGRLSCEGGLTGQLSIPTTIAPGTKYEEYSGEYEITPKAHKAQTLNTKNKLLSKDIVVSEVPYTEASNGAGTTVYIAKEVD